MWDADEIGIDMNFSGLSWVPVNQCLTTEAQLSNVASRDIPEAIRRSYPFYSYHLDSITFLDRRYLKC